MIKIKCSGCSGQGIHRSNVSKRLIKCRKCKGTGQILAPSLICKPYIILPELKPKSGLKIVSDFLDFILRRVR